MSLLPWRSTSWASRRYLRRLELGTAFALWFVGGGSSAPAWGRASCSAGRGAAACGGGDTPGAPGRGLRHLLRLPADAHAGHDGARLPTESGLMYPRARRAHRRRGRAGCARSSAACCAGSTPTADAGDATGGTRHERRNCRGSVVLTSHRCSALSRRADPAAPGARPARMRTVWWRSTRADHDRHRRHRPARAVHSPNPCCSTPPWSSCWCPSSAPPRSSCCSAVAAAGRGGRRAPGGWTGDRGGVGGCGRGRARLERCEERLATVRSEGQTPREQEAGRMNGFARLAVPRPAAARCV